VCLESAEAGKGIEIVHSTPVCRLRGPAASDVSEWREQIKHESGKEANGRTATNIVVVQAMGAPLPAIGVLGSSPSFENVSPTYWMCRA
jgi:hypothetical protein